MAELFCNSKIISSTHLIFQEYNQSGQPTKCLARINQRPSLKTSKRKDQEATEDMEKNAPKDGLKPRKMRIIEMRTYFTIIHRRNHRRKMYSSTGKHPAFLIAGKETLCVFCENSIYFQNIKLFV
ncbi:unnamed protein product [Moneuplotes crassus]|uniref:Uncharacterized protein n=1 Tax=Euplotes crassus TaxID=5936 RepID=A0AAD2D051_EUPCR|nr:unnamed protein product [Moneuplotes crassus]